MHDVAKLVEEGLHFMVLHQRGEGVSWFGEVGHHSRHWYHALPIRPLAAWLQTETGSVSILPHSIDKAN